MKNMRRIGIRIDEELLRKFKIFCIYEGRSVNRQVGYLIKTAVADFEKENGTVVFEKKDQV